MNVSELGEFALIQRLSAAIGAKAPADLILAIGDDAAAWRSGESVLLATTDTLVEGVHFLPTLHPWRDVGWKALAVSVSDVAAMGGEPQFALVTLALPPETPVDAIDEIYAGLRECACAYVVTIVGGDIVRASELSITVALIGRAQMRDGEPLLMRRDAAQIGELIAVTGTLGDSAAGLHRLQLGPAPDEELPSTHLRPHPPLEIAQNAARLGVRCAIDVSDGLLQDIGHISQSSGVAATLLAADIPISKALRDTYPADALEMACTGGEDYQIAFVAPTAIIHQLVAASSSSVSVIGEVTEGPAGVRLLDESGGEIRFPNAGWDHLRS